MEFKFLTLIIFLSVLFLSSCKKNLKEDQSPEEPPQKEVTAKDINWHIDPVYNMVVFKSFEDYHKYWDCNEKEILQNSMKKAKFISLYDMLPKIRETYRPPIRPVLTEFDEEQIPWFFEEDLSNFTQILNPEMLITIDRYTIRVNDEGNFAYISEHNNLATLVHQNDIVGIEPVYNALINDINVQNHVYKYPTDYDIVDMLEENGINNGAELMSLFCWKRGGAINRTEIPAVYFLDETWPSSVVTTQANHSQGTNSNTRMALRLQYIKLGVFFQLMLKGKYQYQFITSDGTRNWKSDVNKDNGETRWSIAFNEKHQGKCKNENEIFNTGTITPPLNDRNKSRRVFWERANGLHKYQISATLSLYTKNAWRGRKTNNSITVQPNHVFTIPNGRLVNSLEIYPFTHFEIKDKY